MTSDSDLTAVAIANWNAAIDACVIRANYPALRELRRPASGEAAEWADSRTPFADRFLSRFRNAITEATPSKPAPDAMREASIPTYGNLPWDQLGRDVMEAVMGSRVDYKFPEGLYPGHDIAHINFNSLARIVDKYRLAAPASTPDWSGFDHSPEVAPRGSL